MGSKVTLDKILTTMDEDDLLELLKSELVFDKLSELEQNQILLFFKNTKSYKLIDGLALFLSDSVQMKLIEAIIDVLQKLRGTNHLSTLIYSCSEFDCSDYAELFADILLTENIHAGIEAGGVISAMKGPIDREVFDRIERKSFDFIKKNKEVERIALLKEAINSFSKITTW